MDYPKDEQEQANSPLTVTVEGHKETAYPTTDALEATPVNLNKSQLLAGRQLAIVFVAFCLAFFLVALDQTILSTAVPTIVSHFNAVSSISWIASAYFLPQAAFMLFFGRVLMIAPAKFVFLVSVAIFELGSLFCAVAPSVNFLIFGRAVAGFGGTGLWVSIMTITAQVTTLKQRPLLMGLFGVIFAVSSVVGPIMGGAFSDHVDWRWCFYINLPIGGAALVAIVFWLPYSPAIEPSQWRTWLYLDWFGTVLSFGMVTFLLIALQWGGNEKPWNDGLVIAFLVLAIVFTLAFALWEYRYGKGAILSVAMICRRTILGCSIAAAFRSLAFVVFNYYLPLMYQVRGHSATRSGIDILPFMVSGVFANMVAGGVASRTGYAWPFLFFTPMIACVGFGVLFTISENTSTSQIAGFQLLVGFGLGFASQLPIVVAQAEYVHEESLVPQATSLVTFFQLMGSSVGLAIGGAIFSTQLKAQLEVRAHELSPGARQTVLESVKAIFALPDDQRNEVARAYTDAITRMFLVGIPSAAFVTLAALLISRKKLDIKSQ